MENRIADDQWTASMAAEPQRTETGGTSGGAKRGLFPFFWLGLTLLSLLSARSLAGSPLPATDLEEDPQSQYVTILSGELEEGRSREILLPLEPGILRLEFILRFTGSVQMTVFDAVGQPLNPALPPVQLQEVAGRRSLLLWDPRPGSWKIRLEGEGAYTFAALVQGELYFCCGYLVTPTGMHPLNRVTVGRGRRYRLQVYLSGFQMDRLDLQLVDGQGQVIAPVSFRQNDLSSLTGLLALLEVPDRPFRVRATGVDLSGKPFQRVLFPFLRFADQSVPPELDSQADPLLLELAETARPGEQALVRAQLLTWSDGPLPGEGGAEIGVRLRYTLRFPVTGVYSPLPQLYPERMPPASTGALAMRLHDLRVMPLPDGVSPPTSATPATPSPLLTGRFTYQAGVDYQFEADLVPNYVLSPPSSAGFCLQLRVYHQPGLRERFEQEVSRERRTRYRFTIPGSTLEARNPALTVQAYDPVRWHAAHLRWRTPTCP
jgi:hypothetical protein